MGEITYRCSWCGEPFQGLSHGYFVTGKENAVLCGPGCLADFATEERRAQLLSESDD